MSSLADMNRRCVFCGQTTRSSEWRGNTGDICPNCHNASNKSREQIELELMEAINNLTLAIQNLSTSLKGIVPKGEVKGEVGGRKKTEKNC